MPYDELKTDLGRRGMTRWTAAGSRFDRQRADETWRVPDEVELREDEDGDLLVWWDPVVGRGSRIVEAHRRYGASMGMKEVEDDGQLFGRFVALGHREPGEEERRGERDPEEVLDFCDRYGVFAVCRPHGQPFPTCPQRHLPYASCEPGRPRVRQLVRLSDEVRTVLRVAGRARDGDDVAWDDCRRLLEVELDPHYSAPYLRDDHHEQFLETYRRLKGQEDAAYLVSQAVNRWLDHGNIRPRLEWRGEGPRSVALRAGSLLGALARHLFLTVTGDVGVAMCDGCGRIFTPENRKPKRGQFTWCYDCGKGSNYRVAKRVHARMRRAEEGKD